MNDWALGAGWIAVLLLGFLAVTVLHRAGLPRTYARDLLHVGAGIWVVGWPWWTGALVPVAIGWTTMVIVVTIPLAASRWALFRKVHDSVAGEEERWAGIIAYAGSFAALTSLALEFRQVGPAASAAVALCLGDGLGGLVGRRLGRHPFKLPWSKAKTWEGTAAVALFSALGIALVSWGFSFPLAWGKVALLGATSAAAEALAPRAWDNVAVPTAVFTVAFLLGQ